MFKEYIVLSGSIGTGKSSLANKLAAKYGGCVIKTNDYIKYNTKLVNGKHKRQDLQKTGERLDKKTNGQWVVDHIEAEKDQLLNQKKEYQLLIIDSVRISDQVDRIRRAYGSKVIHVHLEACESALKLRYEKRKSAGVLEMPSYDDLRKSKTEKNVNSLAKKADVVINTDRCTENDVFIRACANIKLSDHKIEALVDVIVGGQYGSEGKGNIAAHIAPEYDLLVRVGGPNAGHKVFGDPIQTFRHLPSGTGKAPHAKIVLGPGMVINVEVLLNEIAESQLSYDRLRIDRRAIIIEEEDIKTEQATQKSISSTVQGVGSATARRITNRGKYAVDGKALRLAEHINELKQYICDTSEVLERAYENNERILLEGTQGTSLSLYHGTYPYVTSRDTTVAGCLAEAGISPKRVRKVILVCRTYPIRVAGVEAGPMSQDLTWKEVSDRSGIPLNELEDTEKSSVSRKLRRVAEFDWTQLKQSVVLNAPTDIALTFIDYLSVKNKEARRFEQLEKESINFIEEIESVSGVRVSLISTRFDWRSIIDRRLW